MSKPLRENKPLDTFFATMLQLDDSAKGPYLESVYQEIIRKPGTRTKNGDISLAIPSVREMARVGLDVQPWADFVLEVAYSLDAHGMADAAADLVATEQLANAYTVATYLNRNFPNWRSHGALIISDSYQDGSPRFNLRLVDPDDVHGHRAAASDLGFDLSEYNVSLVVHEYASKNAGETRYEVQPTFNYEKLGNNGLGMYSDDVVGGLELSDAVAIAKATLSKDKSKLERALQAI